MRFSIYQDSLVGARQTNQDRMGYCFTRDSLLMVVADGMGGHIRGEIAAQLTLQAIGVLFQRSARPALEDPAGFLDLALRRAHREILRYQQQKDLPESPRTTVVACVVQRGHAWWAHAGDSRLYWLRDGACIGRTEDHSKVQNLVRLGLIRPEDQESHPERNKVLNCLGSPYEPTVEISGAHELRAGDRMLLCSDGVWSAFPEADLCGMLSGGPVSTAVPALVRSAVRREGASADNATALALHWESDGIVQSGDVPDGAITTTIAVSFDDDAYEDELTDDDIERAIREIQQAIEKTGTR